MMMTIHFSHRHPLCPFQSQIQEDDDEENEIICSGCDEPLLSPGLAYKCSKPNCDFYLHDLCFELPKEIRHSSHPKHPLFLFSSSPLHGFTCNACSHSCTAFFNYHCRDCSFGVHVECAALPETVKLEDHQHPLTRICSLVGERKQGDGELSCYVCGGAFLDGCWVYYCKVCQCVATHLNCAFALDEHHEPHIQIQ